MDSKRFHIANSLQRLTYVLCKVRATLRYYMRKCLTSLERMLNNKGSTGRRVFHWNVKLQRERKKALAAHRSDLEDLHLFQKRVRKNRKTIAL